MISNLLVKKIIKIAKYIAIFFFASTFMAVIALRFIPVYITPLMVIRCVQNIGHGNAPKLKHHWVSLDEMSPSMPIAVMASEDSRFLSHHGFDFEQIGNAVMEQNRRRHKRRRGASTISQQTAKNVFLWPSSTWVRKGFEVYFTFMIELCWNKERIMEVYLNSIEMGDGIYGTEAVAEENFNTTAASLTKRQCALIAATLPNPRKFSSANPSNFMKQRQRWILNNMRLIPTFPTEAKEGKEEKK